MKNEYFTEQWVAVEISFEADTTVESFDDAVIDVEFKNRSTDAALTMPAFWDGGNTWRVRFAPTECGVWDYTVNEVSGVSLGLNGITGTVNATEYSGELAIYKHGFVKAKPGVRYFTYADGTPFLYLADTHWGMLKEEFDEAGPNAGDIQTDSHFKYIVDKRVEQGFTVYQSEPIGANYKLDDGKINADDVEAFKVVDKYFLYIAKKGLVHANAHLIFPSGAKTKEFQDNVAALARYWIARYGAYPVMWALGQEVDGGKFGVENLGEVYLNMCAAVYKYDPYCSPLSAHQLNASAYTAKGGVRTRGTDGCYNNYNAHATHYVGHTNRSVFIDAPGHTWWANQWRPVVDQQFNFGIPKDYWENGSEKPVVDYEARYHFLYGGDFCMRAQAWIAFFCGMGHAYGGADMWLYQGRYALDSDANDGVEIITTEKKKTTNWCHLINAPISDQLGHLKAFLTSLEWWKLVPDFDYHNAFLPIESKDGYYACMYEGNSTYAVYLYNRTKGSAGKLINMDAEATYTVKWFDTCTGRYIVVDEALKPVTGQYDIPLKPISSDMVLLVTKN